MCVFAIWRLRSGKLDVASISGRVVEYIVAIDVTRVRFPADAGVIWAKYLQKIACAPELTWFHPQENDVA